MTDLARAMAHKGNGTERQSGVHLRSMGARMPRPRVGQLLLEAGIVHSTSLYQALKLAADSKQPVGRVLVGLGYLAERDLQSALFAQTLIGDGAVTMEEAINAIRNASARKVTLNDILPDLEGRKIAEAELDDGGLGGLLVCSGFISAESFQSAVESCRHSGVLLGRTLLLMHDITAPTLDTALTVLVMIRDGVLTREQGIRCLREVRRSRVGLDDALKSLPIKVCPRARTPRLGEILSQSKLISESENAVAVERALSEKKMLGEILVGSGVLPGQIIIDALRLQQFVAAGAITVEEAAAALSIAHRQNRKLRDVACELRLFGETAEDAAMIELFVQANIVNQETINESIFKMAEYKMGPCKALLSCGAVSANADAAARECLQMIKRGVLKAQQAPIAIDLCERSRTDLKTALAAMGLAPDSASVAEHSAAKKSIMQSVSTTFIDWASYPQFKQLICLVLFALSAGYAAITYAHVNAFLVQWIALVFVSVGLIKLGLSWNKKAQERCAARQLHLGCARETKRRLEQRVR